MRSKWLMLVLLGACRGRDSLIDVSQFAEVDPADDPFDDRPSDDACPALAWSVEVVRGEPALEIDTGLCRYLLVTQPTITALIAGDRVDVRISHDALDAEQPASAHVAVRLDDVVLLDEAVPIPSGAGELTRSVIVDRDLPAGTPVWVHLHNHGANTWNLTEISGGPDTE